MHDEPPHPAPDDAVEQALGELDALRGSAAHADLLEGDHDQVTLHEVEAVGRYAVPYRAGWEALSEAIGNPQLGLGFSRVQQPGFDGFIEPKLTLPPPVAHHLAAVRNTLLAHYFLTTPEGMSAEHALQALEEAAQWLGDALYRDQEGKPALPGQLQATLPEAAAADGARYLYQQLHRAHRQLCWVRPFFDLAWIFGGKRKIDWQLPEIGDTPFLPLTPQELAPLQLGDDATVEEIDAAIARLDQLEVLRKEQRAQRRIAHAAEDLDTIGEQMLAIAEGLRDVAQLSEPVRSDAIEIARDILRKLKVKFDQQKVIDGLDVSPENDEVEELGGLKGVGKIFEGLLGWARGVDASILQHPSIQAAAIALGQLGVALKLEALRMAKQLGQTAQLQQLTQRMGSVPRQYTDLEEEEFAILLYRVEQGIDTVLNRVQEINGPAAAVGHSASKELGSYMQPTPIAGMALQTSEAVTNRNNAQQRMAAQQRESAQRAMAQRMAQQVNAHARSAGGGSAAPVAARGGSGAQIAALRQRLAALRRNVINNSARLSAIRAGQMASIHGHDEEHHGHSNEAGNQHDPLAATLAKIDPRIINNIRKSTSTTGLKTNPVLTGKAAFQKMQQANTQGMKEARQHGTELHDKAEHEIEDKLKHAIEEEEHLSHRPQGPHKGGGRGI